MIVGLFETAAIAVCLAFLFFLSLVEGAIIQSSPLTLRMIQEREEDSAPPLLKLVLEDQMKLLVPIHAGTQLSLMTVAILMTHLSLQRWPAWGILGSFGAVFVLSLVFRQMLPRLLTQSRSEEKLVTLLGLFDGTFRLLRSLALPVSFVLGWSRRAREGEPDDSSGLSESGEGKEEEIQAYLEIGEDEGIIEEEDSKLIQSVMQFGDTVVREVMTPRTKMVACEESATLQELRRIMVDHRHSRIPLYQGELDHVTGMAYIRQLFAIYSVESGSRPAREAARPVLFVPETKPVATLLREFQDRGENAAIVVDEFGGVSGMVTMEDLLEEIVGEIRDEDQSRISEVVEEPRGVYAVRGSTELRQLEESTGRKFDAADYSTVAGLVAERLGRVPVSGEEFEIDGLVFRILDADRKRVRRATVQVPAAERQPATDSQEISKPRAD
jgi:putative hemolysin